MHRVLARGRRERRERVRAVAVIDEVDIVLHPLKSELNWPLGGKVPLDFTTDKDLPGMRWLLPFHALDPFLPLREG